VIPIVIFIVNLSVRLLTLLLVVHVLLTYFMSPFHPIRNQIDRIVVPLLNPIRRILPSVGMYDFSPLVFILLLEIIRLILINLLLSFQ
jgi:YggT family protein